MAPRSAGDRQATGSALSVDRRIGRRAFLKGAGAVGAAGVIAPALSTGPALARGAAAQSGTTPLQHIIVDCQENRSFDHYYGFAPFAGQFGVPAGYSQPDGQGGSQGLGLIVFGVFAGAHGRPRNASARAGSRPMWRNPAAIRVCPA